MPNEIRFSPLKAQYLMPYFKGYTENIARYQMAAPFADIRETADYFRECRERRDAGYSYVFVILDEQGAFIGSIEANALTCPIPSVGLWITEEKHGRGYGTRALTKMLDILRENGYRYALYETDIRNESAKALLKSISFEKTGPVETVAVSDTKSLQLQKYVIRL